MGGYPAARVHAVLHRRREGVLRPESVVDGNDLAAAGIAEGTADRIVGIQATGNQAPSVEVDQGWERRTGGTVRRVEAHGKQFAARWNRQVTNRRHGFRGPAESQQLFKPLTTLRRGKA